MKLTEGEVATLIQVFSTLFPDHPRRDFPFSSAPRMPTDLFAYVAHVVERSGAYHHVVPKTTSRDESGLRALIVDETMRNRAVQVGQLWRTKSPPPGLRLPAPPSEVETLWQSLDEYRHEPVFAALDDDSTAPDWWKTCLELLMIADEACRGIGFEADNRFFSFIMDEYTAEDLSTGRHFRRVQRAPFSLSEAAEDLLCVQAKSRTPSVGCTLRSLTHHLALLPPRGHVRARWVAPLFAPDNSEGNDKLGLLLVPFPHRISNSTFRPIGLDATSNWGWFSVDQSWLPLDSDKPRRTALISYFLSLITNARQRGLRVNAVVLPELALNYTQFRALADWLARDRDIDFLICGLSRDQSGRSGNFVAIAPFFLLGRERGADIRAWHGIILIREKHHRWKLDESQISAYRLDSLDSTKSWWEELNILGRGLDLLVYKGSTTLTTLICEDLARVDPCQAVVRAVGPNLLIALLMDGPQLSNRWPSRYATVLAEDPGTSVLSFTSFGLIARQNDHGAYDQASSIALWKDERTGPKRLELHREADALLLSIRPVHKEERTLDGRADGGASIRWEYETHEQIKATDTPSWIREGTGRP